MPKLPRWTAIEAERALPGAGFELLRSKGSHRIYGIRASCESRFRFHSGAALHSKIIKQVLETIEGAGQSTATEEWLLINALTVRDR
jgi:predicted RNA binding protein YcfA (HicA-like mRNA interferase family)